MIISPHFGRTLMSRLILKHQFIKDRFYSLANQGLKIKIGFGQAGSVVLIYNKILLKINLK